MKKIIAIFLTASIPFATVMIFLEGELLLGLRSGIIFGSLMAIAIGSINYVIVNLRGGSAISGVRQTNEIELPLPFSNVFELCKESTVSIKGTKITFEDYANGIIRAKTGVNLSTWGDKIEFQLLKINEESTKVQIKSRPVVPTTIVDYGKNLKNIKSVTSYLQQSVHKS